MQVRPPSWAAVLARNSLADWKMLTRQLPHAWHGQEPMGTPQLHRGGSTAALLLTKLLPTLGPQGSGTSCKGASQAE